MARNRQIKADFWSDEKMGGLSLLTRIMFIGLWNFADDEGLLRWNPSYIRSSVFPYEDISLNKIKDSQTELIEQKLIMPYKKENQSYAWIINFSKHQKINRPQVSRLPAPRYDYHVYRDIIHERDKYVCKKCGVICNPNNISIDHNVPVFKGGTDHPSNLQVMCIKCNKSKGIKPLHEQFTEHSLKEQGIEREDSLLNVNVNENENVNVNVKEKYLEFVLLLKSEHEKLLNQFGNDRLSVMIENLNNYLGSTGKKYKSHYHTLLAWERKNGTTSEQNTPRIKFNPQVPFDPI